MKKNNGVKAVWPWQYNEGKPYNWPWKQKEKKLPIHGGSVKSEPERK